MSKKKRNYADQIPTENTPTDDIEITIESEEEVTEEPEEGITDESSVDSIEDESIGDTLPISSDEDSSESQGEESKEQTEETTETHVPEEEVKEEKPVETKVEEPVTNSENSTTGKHYIKILRKYKEEDVPSIISNVLDILKALNISEKDINKIDEFIRIDLKDDVDPSVVKKKLLVAGIKNNIF